MASTTSDKGKEVDNDSSSALTTVCFAEPLTFE
jgi:hypothetical protein